MLESGQQGWVTGGGGQVALVWLDQFGHKLQNLFSYLLKQLCS